METPEQTAATTAANVAAQAVQVASDVAHRAADTADRVADNVSVAVVSNQIISLKELMMEKLVNQDAQLTLIKEQTTKTNGHVADAFREIDKLKTWRAFLTGAWAIVTLMVLPVVMYLLYQRLK